MKSGAGQIVPAATYVRLTSGAGHGEESLRGSVGGLWAAKRPDRDVRGAQCPADYQRPSDKRVEDVEAAEEVADSAEAVEAVQAVQAAVAVSAAEWPPGDRTGPTIAVRRAT